MWLVLGGLAISAGLAGAQGLGFGDVLVAAAFQYPPPKVSGQMFLNSVVVAKDTVSAGVQDDTDKRAGRAGNGVIWQTINRSDAAGTAESNPKTRLSVSVGGSPPEILKPGVKFDITLSVQGTAEEGNDFSVGAGLAVNGVEFTCDPPDRDQNRVAAWGHGVNGKYIKVPSDQITYHCTVTSNSLELSGGDVWIVPFVSATGPLATYLYRCQPTASNAPPAEEAAVVTAEVVPLPARTNQIRARLLKPAITLVPGEMPEHCGVYISGFRDNTEDQVQIRVPLLGDMWGSLRQNPDIRVDGGDWNEAPDYMYGDEHYVLMSWQSRVLARPATEVVPITVRQNGAGEVVLLLQVTIAPRPVVPGGPPRATGTAGSTGVGNKPPFLGPHFQPQRPPVVMMSLDQLYARALQCLERKEYTKAETILRELVHRDPKKAAYHFALGQAREGQKNWEEAATSYGEAVRLEDNNVEYRVHWGNALLALGRPEQAENNYRDGIEEQPNAALLHFGLGGALAVQQQWADAEAPHREAVKLEPANAEYQFRLGIDYAFQGKAAQEEACMREAVRLNPGNAIYRDALGSALFRLCRWAESEAAYRQAIGIDGGNGSYHANLAGTLLKQNRRDEAQREAETAQKLGCVGHPAFQELGLTGPGR